MSVFPSMATLADALPTTVVGKKAEKLRNRVYHSNLWISNLLKKAINRAKKQNKISNSSIEGVLIKFVKALSNYVLYGQTHVQDYHEKAILGFAKIPYLEKIKFTEDAVALLKLVQKITNVICINFPNLHAPPADILEKMQTLVQALKNITSYTGSPIEHGVHIYESKTGSEVHSTSFIRDKKNLFLRVSEQIERSRLCLEDKSIETMIRKDMKEVFGNYPNHKLHLFGSRGSGQALEGSDFDFFCDTTGNDYFIGMPIEDQKSLVKEIGKLMKQKRNIFGHVEALPKARVPIVNLIHKHTRMECDINFKDGLGVENTKLLKVYLDLDSRVRWVLTAVKLWAEDNDIKSNRTFRSHGLSWLVLFYLMKVKLVPPFKDLQKNCEPMMINGYNAAFSDPTEWWIPETDASELELFKGFFRWVVTGELTSYCLSPYTGEAIPKKSFKKMTWIKNYTPMKMNGDFGLCVHDPIEHCQNIVRDVKYVVYTDFVALCSQTFDILDGF